MIHQILAELNENNSTNYKLETLKKYKDNELLQRVLKMTYDKVAYTYGITMKNVEYEVESNYTTDMYTLSHALDELESKFCTRDFTGNLAISHLSHMLTCLSKEDAKLIELILGRDLKINVGKTQINKVWKNLIVKPPYMRCGVYSEKTAKKVKFAPGAVVQLKADGTYRSVLVENGTVTFNSRSGEEYQYPELEKIFKSLKDGVYIGELLVDGTHNRAESNGLINSDNPPHDKIYIQLWDFITLDEWSRPKDKKNKTVYSERFEQLRVNIVGTPTYFIQVIPFQEVGSIKDALEFTSDMMNKGFEGAILKDWDNIFVDHTSPTQLKLKLEIDAEVRIIGFEEGTPGTRREKTFGAIVFQNDEGTIKGKTSGFTDAQLEDFNARREELIGKIITVQFNDVSKARGHDYYALSHPRFIEIRNDKDETDTIEKVLELRQMAMQLK